MAGLLECAPATFPRNRFAECTVTRGFAQLQDVVTDPDFPGLDLALRRGRHVDRDDPAWYALLLDAQAHLEEFYRRYGCELIYKNDGYFFLLPTTDQLPRRQLSTLDMVVGQALSLQYLDPASVQRGGMITREQVIEQLVTTVGSETLMAAFLPKRKRQDELVAQRLMRAKIAEALRRLAHLGFVDQAADEHLRLRPALLRFAEPVRGTTEPHEALARLLAQGEIALAPSADEPNDAAEDAPEDPAPGSPNDTVTDDSFPDDNVTDGSVDDGADLSDEPPA